MSDDYSADREAMDAADEAYRGLTVVATDGLPGYAGITTTRPMTDYVGEPMTAHDAYLEAMTTIMDALNDLAAAVPREGIREWDLPGGGVVWTAPGGRVMIQRVEPGNWTSTEARLLAAANYAGEPDE